MADSKPDQTAAAAVEALVERFATQLKASAASSKQQQAELKALAKKTKNPGLRQAAGAAIKQHDAFAAEADARTKQVQSATDLMVADLEDLIETATRPW